MTKNDHPRQYATTPLWAGICCPALPLTAVWGMLPESGPVAVHDTVGGQPRIIQASRAARQAGIRPGQSLASALSIVPSLQSRPRKRLMEQRALEHMALTAYGHSHQVVLAGFDTVVLEVAGSRRLRGGVNALIDTLCEELDRQGFTVRSGTAVTPAAARLLARLGKHTGSFSELFRLLETLPLESLDLSRQQCQALAGCGLHTTGELMRLPAAARARRFGPQLNDHLRRIRGEHPEPMENWQPPERYHLHLELPSTTTNTQALLFVFQRAIDHLDRWLEVRDHALVQLHVTLEREDRGIPPRFEVGLARPGMDRVRLLELIGLKLEPLRLSAPVAGLKLAADTTVEHRPPQADLFSGHNRTDAWPALLDRLSARLGRDGLCSLAPESDHRPEKAWIWTSPGITTPCPDTRPRPAWLLPEPRCCRRQDLCLEEGPERIESGWWDGFDCRRDYWIARDQQGRRLWVFREHKPRSGWFLHGIFG